MAGGKETPRQKMIGMMYLVLTALLALNVSKSILDAFVAIEENIQVANENEFYRGHEKKEIIIEKTQENDSPELKRKAKRLLAVVNQIDQMTAQRIKELDALKLDILKEGGENIQAIGGEHIIQEAYSEKEPLKPIRMRLDFVQGQDKYDEPMRVMLGDQTDIKKPTGKGLVMYNNFMKYRNDLVSLIVSSSSTKDQQFELSMPDIRSFKSEQDKLMLITEAIKNGKVQPDDVDVVRKVYAALTKNEYSTVHDQKDVHWLGKTFDHAPTVAALASLTSLQKEILTARADAIATIQQRIGGGEFSFNTIMPLAYGPEIANQNEEVELQVLMAAFDSDKQPQVTVNGGSLKYIKDGKGIIIAKSGGNEMHLTGTISIKNKSGITKTLPWEKTIQVIKPQGTVSLPKMNVLYRGYKNEIEAAASGYPDIKVSGTGVNLIKDSDGKYIGMPITSGRTATISITGSNKTTGKTAKLGTFTFRVMNLPRPNFYFGTSGEGDLIDRNETKMFVKYGPEIPLDASFDMISWEMSTNTSPKPARGTGRVLNQDGINLLRQSKSGTIVTFMIKAVGPDRGERRITASFRVR